MKLALSLSGGGFRALGFHLGILARLAEENQLEQITFLSTVSAGSLCIGLVYALNNFSWPSSQDYLTRILPEARRFLMGTSLEMGLLRRFLRSPWRLLDSRADDLSYLLKQDWKIDIPLHNLPEQPRWMINATCYETGKNWRFERFRMGDYLFGYTYDMNLSLSDALAASSGFPGLIGPLALDTHPYEWFQYVNERNDFDASEAHRQNKTEPKLPMYSKLHLYDGGIYDNNGLEGIHDFLNGWHDDIEFLIVGDAAGRPSPEAYQGGFNALMRLVTGILMDQVRSLRARAILERMLNHHDPGVFLQIGNSCESVLSGSRHAELLATLRPQCLTSAQADAASAMPTRLRPLSTDEFELLFRHGFEVMDYTLLAYYPSEFKYVGYQNSRWA